MAARWTDAPGRSQAARRGCPDPDGPRVRLLGRRPCRPGWPLDPADRAPARAAGQPRRVGAGAAGRRLASALRARAPGLLPPLPVDDRATGVVRAKFLRAR